MRKQVIGERLKALRGEMSREEVAVKLGVTAQAVYNYEIGVRVPTDDRKSKIASIFGKTVQEIFFD